MAVGADDQRDPGQLARAGGVNGVLRKQVDAVGQPVGKSRRPCGALELQHPGGAAQLSLRQRLDLGERHAQPLQELVRLLRSHLTIGDQWQRRTLRDRPAEQAIGRTADQQREHGRGARRLAENGHSVRVAAEGGDVLPDPPQCGHLVAQREIVVEAVAEVGQLETAEHPDPVGDVDHHHVSVGGQPGPVVQLELPGAVYKGATRDPHHHRQRAAGVGRPHRQSQTRLVANLRIIAAAAHE